MSQIVQYLFPSEPKYTKEPAKQSYERNREKITENLEGKAKVLVSRLKDSGLSKKDKQELKDKICEILNAYQID